jgi:predicted O-linked N-acetylglucosamine transferase (SPINDLY family)
MKDISNIDVCFLFEGVSLLSTIGYDFLIANTEEEYFKLAVSLATSPQRLKTIRENLRNDMKQSYLCDGPTFTKNIEEIYRDLWLRYLQKQQSKPPKEALG